jgi:hypothetical protein
MFAEKVMLEKQVLFAAQGGDQPVPVPDVPEHLVEHGQVFPGFQVGMPLNRERCEDGGDRERQAGGPQQRTIERFENSVHSG